MTEDVPPDSREDVGKVFDVMDEFDGDFYLGGFIARVGIGVTEICAVILLLLGAVYIVRASLDPSLFRQPLVGLTGCAAYTLFALWRCVVYVRSRNRSAAARKISYVGERRAGGLDEVDDAFLSRKFRAFAEWPVWVAHGALLAVVLYGLARHLQFIG